MVRFPVRVLGIAALWFAFFTGTPALPPSASAAVQLPDGAHLHLLALPLGRLDGIISGPARFDRSGTRAVFLAEFPGATLTGDWRSLNPVQAFSLDAARRTLTQLTIDGQARAANWSDEQTVWVQDGDRRNLFAIQPASQVPLPELRMASPDAARQGSVLGRGGQGRFLIVKTDAGRYALEQIGARALRSNGTAPNGAYAIVGNFLVWADRSRGQGSEIAREGARALAPPSFAGSPYGDALSPILPLGHAVYQGGYRNGVAYFAFTYGLRRIVASTSDFVNYAYPAVPSDLSYSLGDGIGAGPSNNLYFAWPEGGEVTFWRDARYVQEPLSFPAHVSEQADLDYSMERLAPGDPLWPPLRPDEDALDAAMLQWRFYPIGDALGDVWIASYLGRLLISNASGAFRFAGAPQFPFALLGRTDDGRIWGASPELRLFTQSVFTDATSTLWWTRDGISWLEAGTIPGDPGAVGLDHRRVWLALTHPWFGRAEIEVMPLGTTSPSPAVTGGTYGGEQLFFASLPQGFYIVWGAAPGRRLGGDQGTLCAYRIDQAALFSLPAGNNIFEQQLLDPQSDPSLPAASYAVEDAATLAQPTLNLLKSLPAAVHSVLATNLDGVQVDPQRVIEMGLDQERAFEIKYAGVPYPLAIVSAQPASGGAMVTRSFLRGPLMQLGSLERWSRSGDRWRRSSMLRW